MPFTIHERQNLNCRSAHRAPIEDSFGRVVAAGHGSKLQLLKNGTSVYTCDAGSGTILASMQVFATSTTTAR